MEWPDAYDLSVVREAVRSRSVALGAAAVNRTLQPFVRDAVLRGRKAVARGTDRIVEGILEGGHEGVLEG